ncbi:M14 metallopeptidase family protein [Flavobacteriaceae bacterium 3-367]|uniref:M14 family metallopeptidase n=1 Tax=Eudoraea algarum TaxID=3417568 RepID=UPI00327D3F51
MVSFESVKAKAITDRYVVWEDVQLFLEHTPVKIKSTLVGRSVQGRPIELWTLGKGPIKILMWSQMHGNESTTTKATMDFVNFLLGTSPLAETIKVSCTFQIIPMLNPDGAVAYTRVNANGVDLNRDAQALTQPESGILRKVYDTFGPDYCFNLHDQRTIFNVGETSLPATVSFLAPAHDEARTVSKTRALSMKLVVAMNRELQALIPGQVGRYDDAFNPNCVGDTFQMLHTPTVLFEAGHFPGDYAREHTRKYIWHALLSGVKAIAYGELSGYTQEAYHNIPENGKRFVDILIQNIAVLNTDYKKDEAMGVLFKEVLQDRKIVFEPHVEKIGKLDQYYGHERYNCLNDKDLTLLRANMKLMKLL